MRVVIADPAEHVRSALHLLLDQHAGATCVAKVTSGKGLVSVVASTNADVLLVDSHMPDFDLPLALATLRAVQPRLRTVVLSTRPEERTCVLAAGANAFVSKGDAPQELFETLGLGRYFPE